MSGLSKDVTATVSVSEDSREDSVTKTKKVSLTEVKDSHTTMLRSLLKVQATVSRILPSTLPFFWLCNLKAFPKLSPDRFALLLSGVSPELSADRSATLLSGS